MVGIALMELPARAADALAESPAAFRAFYEEALPRVYGYFFHRCGGQTGVVEDLAQETFLAAVRELKRGAQVGAPIPWILGIARHKLVDHFRAREREDRRLAAVWEAETIEDARVTWRGEESRAEAIAALAELPAFQRAALILRYVDGLSVPEAAKALGRSIEATESLLARGRENFKRSYLGARDG